MKYPPLSDNSINEILSFLDTKSEWVFLETSKTDKDNFHSYIFYDPVTVIHFHKHHDVDEFFRQASAFHDKGLYLAGSLAYEFGYALEPTLRKYLRNLDERPLVTLGVFREPIIFDHRQKTFSLPLPGAEAQGGQEEQSYSLENIRPSISKEKYLHDLETIKSYIEAGDTYQVNHTLKLLFDFDGSPTALYKTLRLNQPVSYSAFLKLAKTTCLSFSPELFFSTENDTCTVKPMKGTMPRGLTRQDDQHKAQQLHNDSKNRSENVMIVDLLRNDLGRLSQKGSIRMTSMFDVETYATLHQMTSTITGKLRPETGLQEIFKAFFPCGSVTGAPKIRTMEIIRELEDSPRGIYTGAIGFIAPDGKCQFNVPIRTVEINKDRAEMGIGAGIVHDSNPEEEWHECLLKARFLTHSSPDFQLIETLLWTPEGGFYLLDNHIQRLADSASYFDFPFERQEILASLNTLVSENRTKRPARIRILLSRDGSASMSSTECEAPKMLALPHITAPNNGTLPAVTLSTRRTCRQSPFLYHKTTNRQLYAEERDNALAQGFHEVIFANEDGEITEGSISTIFVQQKQSYLTPLVKSGLLPGTFRKYLLEHHANQIEEKVITPDDLRKADAIFIANSVRGITQVQFCADEAVDRAKACFIKVNREANI